MKTSHDDSGDSLEVQQQKARQLISSDKFWITVAAFMLLLGLVGRFGINWLVMAGAGAVACLVGCALIPMGRAHRRVAMGEERQTLLEKWSLIVAKLSRASLQRYDRLHNRVSRLGDLQQSKSKRSLLQPGEYLLWLYLKLLLARDFLEDEASVGSTDSIQEQRRLIAAELQGSGLTANARNSKEETLLILDQRLDAARSRAGRIQEIESDLTRIEHKLALMQDRAAQHNTLGDSGRRIDFSDEIQTGASLASLNTSSIEELDSLVTAQVYA